MIRRIRPEHYEDAPRVSFKDTYYEGYITPNGAGQLKILDRITGACDVFILGYNIEYTLEMHIDEQIERTEHYLSVLKEVKDRFPKIKSEFTQEEIEEHGKY